MIDKKDFTTMRKELKDFDSKREQIIKKSRDINIISKKAIYSLHRNQLKTAESSLKKAKSEISKIQKQISKTPSLESIGAFNAAMQEYTEGYLYLQFLKTGKLAKKRSVGIDSENYLLAVCDLTGELGRKAVHSAIANDLQTVQQIKDVITEIHGQFLEFDFRNSELRKKSDSIKWNLKKVEEVLYDMKLKK